MDIIDTKRLEHICLYCEQDLKSFGEKFQTVLTLPTMEYDFENETEWLTVDVDGINYNISKPYEEGTLQEWDEETPKDCNIGIVISLHKDHVFVSDNLWVDKMVANICRKLAKALNTTIYHHRTFIFGQDISDRKNIVFNP